MALWGRLLDRLREGVVWWRYEDAGGSVVSGPEIEFDDQGEAEEWLGREWPGLLEGGVAAVTLVDGVDEVYGPMSLRPAE